MFKEMKYKYNLLYVKMKNNDKIKYNNDIV